MLGGVVMKVKKVNKVNPKDLLKKSYTDNVQSTLESKGVRFSEPEKTLNIDEEHLVLPKDITEVPAKSLGKYLNAFTQQKMYMRTLIGWCECMIEDSRRVYMSVAIEHYKKANSTKMSEKAKDTEVNNHPEVLPLYNNYRDLQIKKSMLDLQLSNLEDAIFLISREISRRNGDFENETRNINVGRY